MKALILFFLFAPSLADAACAVKSSSGQAAFPQSDPIFAVLAASSGCPQNVQEWKAALSKAGYSTKPYMVANRGFHNPKLGSFSFFEEVVGHSVGEGQFFFGHFTGAVNGKIELDQGPAKAKLMIELIAWDAKKSLYNFYELIGNGRGGDWFYRGDSADILADNAKLFLGEGSPQFGNRLRCSGCHASGGPIMKELSAPYNDWWTAQRGLLFSPNALSEEVAKVAAELNDASLMSQSVQKGIYRLDSSQAYQKAKDALPLQAQLRPLFCETEINLESDGGGSALQIPAASVVNPALASGAVSMSRNSYESLLAKFGMQFPETNFSDADHAWLVPVKGFSDHVAVQTLVNRGIISQEFASDVLAVDMEHPLFSAKRCGLLKLVGQSNFKEALRASNLPGAGELFANLTDPQRNQDFHGAHAEALLAQAKEKASSAAGREMLFRGLLGQRASVFDSEISKNPRGQILEPGFRLIFPEAH
jgi:hypothetical protein